MGLKQASVSAIEVGRRTTTLDVLEKWLDVCGSVLSIDRPQAGDPKADLLRGLAHADPALVAQISRTAVALAALPAEDRERETWMLEARAGLVQRPGDRADQRSRA